MDIYDGNEEYIKYFGEDKYQSLDEWQDKYGIDIMYLLYYKHLTPKQIKIFSFILYECIHNQTLYNKKHILNRFRTTTKPLSVIKNKGYIDIINDWIIPMINQSYINGCVYQKPQTENKEVLEWY